MFSRHKMNTTFFLAWLINSVQQKTGTPHYNDLSVLLECAHIAYGHEMPFIGEEAVRKTYTRFMRDSPFRDLLTPQSKQNLLIVGVIFLLVQFMQSGQFIETFSAPPKSTEVNSSGESLVDSIERIFQKKSDPAES